MYKVNKARFRVLSLLLTTAALILLFAAQASAMLAVDDPELNIPKWGAETYTSTFYAPSYYTDSESSGEGGAGYLQAASVISDDRGNAMASASLGLTPQLKAQAFHTSGVNGAKGVALAMEGYTYTGSDAATLRLNADLTGSLFDPYSSDKVYIQAEIYVFKAANFEYCPDPGTLFYEYMAALMTGTPYSDDASEMFLEFDESVTDGWNSGSIVFDVDPGETFYVWARLTASAVWDESEADAYHTLDLSFADSSNLIAQSSVPVPSGFLLMFSGILGLSFLSRRQCSENE